MAPILWGVSPPPPLWSRPRRRSALVAQREGWTRREGREPNRLNRSLNGRRDYATTYVRSESRARQWKGNGLWPVRYARRGYSSGVSAGSHRTANRTDHRHPALGQWDEQSHSMDRCGATTGRLTYQNRALPSAFQRPPGFAAATVARRNLFDRPRVQWCSGSRFTKWRLTNRSRRSTLDKSRARIDLEPSRTVRASNGSCEGERQGAKMTCPICKQELGATDTLRLTWLPEHRWWLTEHRLETQPPDELGYCAHADLAETRGLLSNRIPAANIVRKVK